LANTPRLAALITAIALAGATAGDATPALAASFTVNATHDAPDSTPGDGICADANGSCTLRAAVEETNALPGADEISVPAGEFPGVVSIKDSVTITGAGASATTIRGRAPDEIGSVIAIGSCAQPASTASSVEISGVSITAGLSQGGGIVSCGPSTVLRAVVVHGNGGAGLDGGGVWNSGVLSIVDSTISDNWAQEGGAIFNNLNAQLSISNSTISSNQTIAGTGDVRNISGHPAALTNVTLLAGGSRADGYAGIFGAAQLKNTIIANAGQGANCAGAVASLGHNVSTDASCNLGALGDKPGVQAQLTGLQHNGGPTPTHALYPNSPAIDAGDNGACPAADQRGVARPHGAACDIGAYEYVTPPTRPPTAPPTPAPPPPPPPPTPAPTANPPLNIRGSATPSPTPSAGATAAPATRRPKPRPTFTPTLIDVPPIEAEITSGGVNMLASGLLAAGVVGLIGSAAGGGYYWRRKRLGRRRRG
jgi:hypothetical protein